MAKREQKRSSLESDLYQEGEGVSPRRLQLKRELASKSYDEQVQMLRPSPMLGARSSAPAADAPVQMKGGDDPYSDISNPMMDRVTEWLQRKAGLLGPEIPANTKVTSVVDENGLATKSSMSTYITKMQLLVSKWPDLSPSLRKAWLTAIIKGTLAEYGVPEVRLKFRGGKPRGSFSASSWTIKLNKSLADPNSDTLDDPAQLASTFYHEARHAEQKFQIVRMMSAAGWTNNQITRHTGLPAKVVKAGADAPLISGSQKELALLCYHTQYGVHRERRSKILADKKKYLKELRAARKELKELKAGGNASNSAMAKARKKVTRAKARYKAAYAGYKTLPNEVDAWRVGGLIKSEYTKTDGWYEQFFSKL